MNFMLTTLLFADLNTSLYEKNWSTLCSDTSTSCSAWEEQGECTGDNSDTVSRLCPASCGLCSPGCEDVSNDCVPWAKEGQCTTNTDYMLRSCPIACGVCTAVCKDSGGEKCSVWKEQGRCHDAFVSRVCPMTCDLCTLSVLDKSESCSWWAKSGNCITNPSFMLKTCPLSCDLNTCEEDNTTQCVVWGDYECKTNPEAVVRQCPVTCGACSFVCVDKDESCLTWASEGECEANPRVLHTTCPASCGLCSDVGSLTNEKEEL